MALAQVRERKQNERPHHAKHNTRRCELALWLVGRRRGRFELPRGLHRVTAVLAQLNILQRVQNDAESVHRRKVGWTRAAQDAAETAFRPREESQDAFEPVGDAVASEGENAHVITRRSAPAAVVLTFLVVLVAALIVIGIAEVAYAVAGDVAGTVARVAAEIAVLSFVTLRAYPSGARIPWAALVVVTILITAVLPLIYLSWRWVSRRPPSPLPVSRLPGL